MMDERTHARTDGIARHGQRLMLFSILRMAGVKNLSVIKRYNDQIIEVAQLVVMVCAVLTAVDYDCLW